MNEMIYTGYKLLLTSGKSINVRSLLFCLSPQEVSLFLTCSVTDICPFNHFLFMMTETSVSLKFIKRNITLNFFSWLWTLDTMSNGHLMTRSVSVTWRVIHSLLLVKYNNIVDSLEWINRLFRRRVFCHGNQTSYSRGSSSSLDCQRVLLLSSSSSLSSSVVLQE